MADETYDRISAGILDTNHTGPIDLFIDDWRQPTTNPFPPGPDNRSTAALQEHDFRNASGVQVQYDWSTWANSPTLDPTFGLYTPADRLQAGHNIDRMPDLSSGWAEIEIDWTQGVPPANNVLPGAFAGLVGFHKEINREQNLEINPIVDPSDNQVYMLFDAWPSVAGPEARWKLPAATTINDGRNIPEPGDRYRVRWEQVSATNLNIRVSYYDASTDTWHKDVINITPDVSNIAAQGGNTINYLDEYHTVASVTIDTIFYSIRYFRVGTLDTYPNEQLSSAGESY
jgi:hypothetical protein